MFGKKSTIRKYKYKLRPALAKRYGGSATYTKGQVDTTIAEMGFDKKHIHYAYLMYCDVAIFKENTPANESTDSMHNRMNNVSGMGFFGSLFGLSYFSDSGCGGSSGDIGSSGGDAGGGE